MLYLLLALLACVLALLGLLVLIDQLVRRNLQRWLPAYVRDRRRRRDPRPGETVHLILCIADHFEPDGGEVTPEAGLEMVQRWVSEYPRQFGSFRDSDGRPPRHTFFYPLDEYDSAHLDILQPLCWAGYGEIEIHLHHEDDTAAELREMLLACKTRLAGRHGLLPVDRHTGEIKYGFVHGNWALDNSLPDGKHCGVDTELEVLRGTGCYADFTLPSAPSAAQVSTINRIYYAVEDGRPRSHQTGIPVGVGPVPERGLMLVQGPLLLDWQRRKLGLLPPSRTVVSSPASRPAWSVSASG